MAKDHPTGQSGLYQAFLQLKTPEQCYRFLQDVCSYSELSAMEQRYNIAEMLVDKRIYTEIMDKTGASSAIISRVSLFTYLGAALLIFCYYRTFSRNISKRTEDLSVSIQEKLRETDKVIIIDEAQNLKFLTLEEIRGWVDEDIFTGKPGIGIVLIGNVEVYNKMLGKQEAIFAQQFNRTKLHGRYRTSDIQREDVVKFFPVLEEKGMQKEIDYLLSISHSKWGIRGMVSVFNNAVNNEDISFEGLEKMANTMGIRFI